MSNDKISPIARAGAFGARVVSVVPGIDLVKKVTAVDLGPTSLTVSAPGEALAGSTFAVTVSGLAAGEAYTIALGAGVAAAGKAPTSGTVSAEVTLYLFQGKGSVTIGAVGADHDRAGTTTIAVLPAQFVETKRI